PPALPSPSPMERGRERGKGLLRAARAFRPHPIAQAQTPLGDVIVPADLDSVADLHQWHAVQAEGDALRERRVLAMAVVGQRRAEELLAVLVSPDEVAGRIPDADVAKVDDAQ